MMPRCPPRESFAYRDRTNRGCGGAELGYRYPAVSFLEALPEGSRDRGEIWRKCSNRAGGRIWLVANFDRAETLDAYRESLFVRLSEPYGMMLGYVRHEIGHYYRTAIVTSEAQWAASHISATLATAAAAVTLRLVPGLITR